MSTYAPLVGDVESGVWGDKGPDTSFLFAEKAVRQGFVRKVFGLLSLQLLLTAGITALFSLHEPTKMYMLSNMWPFWTSFGGSFALILTMAFWPDARRKHPYNLLLLAAFTACESVLVGTCSALYAPQTVLLAVGITAGVVVALALFTLQTKVEMVYNSHPLIQVCHACIWSNCRCVSTYLRVTAWVDFTASSGTLYTLLWTLIFAGVLQTFIRAPILHLAIAVGGALLFSVYLVFDLQMLMGGGRYSTSPDEYIFATLTIYLDVINLFLYILQLVNETQRN